MVYLIQFQKEVGTMPAGQISKDKIRTNITFPKELKSKLEELAKKDGRSLNSMVIKILSDYVNGIGK